MYSRAADMRRGFDSLCGMVREEFLQNPLSGDVFIFLSKRKSRIKLLQWQGDGFAIFQKRLEKGTYEMPGINAESTGAEISSQQLMLIFEGIKLCSVRKKPRYEKFDVNKFSKQDIDSTEQRSMFAA